MGKVGKEGRRAPRAGRRTVSRRLSSMLVNALYDVAVARGQRDAEMMGKLKARSLVTLHPGRVFPWQITDRGLDVLAKARRDPLGELSSAEMRSWYARATCRSPMLDALAETVAATRKNPGPCGIEDALAIERVLVAVRAGSYARAYKAVWQADTGARELLPDGLYPVLRELHEAETSPLMPDEVWAKMRLAEIDQSIKRREAEIAKLRAERAKIEEAGYAV